MDVVDGRVEVEEKGGRKSGTKGLERNRGNPLVEER